MFENIKIRTKLITGFLMVIFLFGIVGYFGIQTTRETLKEEIGASSALLARESMDKIDRDIYYRLEEVYSYSGDLILQEAVEKSNNEFLELDNIQEYINNRDEEWTSAPKGYITPFMQELLDNELSRELKEKSDFYEKKYGYRIFTKIYVTNKYGVNIGLVGPTIDYFQADEEWYQTAIKEKEFWVGDVYYDESTEVYALNIVVKLYDKNENFSGILRAVLDIKSTFDIIKNLEQVEEAADFKLLTRDGKIIYSTGEFEFFADMQKELTACLNGFQSVEGSHYFIGERGLNCVEEKLFSYSHSDGSDGYQDYKGQGWILLIEHEIQEVFAPVSRLRNILIVILLAMIVFGLLVAFYISRSIPRRVAEADRLATLTTKNLSTIIPVLQKISIGDFREKIKVLEKKDEFTELLKALNLMIGDLEKISQENKQLVIGLEEKIEERTEQLEQAKSKAETILASIGDGVYAVDKKGRIILFNAAAEKITGWTAEKVMGEICSEVVKMERAEEKNNSRKIYCPTDEVLENGKVVSLVSNVFCLSKKGCEVAVSITAAPIKDARGKIIGAIAVFRDVSREVKIDRMKSEFVSIASHQLRTPLTGIKWLIELILNERIPGELNKEQKEALNNVYESNERMIKLISDLVDVSHIETDTKFYIDLKQVNATSIIESIIKDETKLIKNRKIKISIKTPKQWLVRADKDKIRQVMQNLIDNAIKYSKIGGPVEIGSVESEKEMVFYVKDSGIGIPQHQQERIFEKFFRADNVIDKKEQGTGLGLYIARAIVKSHKGKLWLESEENKGSTFYFSLPI